MFFKDQDQKVNVKFETFGFELQFFFWINKTFGPDSAPYNADESEHTKKQEVECYGLSPTFAMFPNPDCQLCCVLALMSLGEQGWLVGGIGTPLLMLISNH